MFKNVQKLIVVSKDVGSITRYKYLGFLRKYCDNTIINKQYDFE